MSTEALCLRAEKDGDADFLKAVYFSTREDLLQLGLSLEMLSSLIDMQFSAQRRGYLSRYPASENFIVEKDGEPIGFLVKNRGEMEIRLVHIALVPEERGKGHGRAIVENLQKEAAMASRPLSLSVDPRNDIAMNLYLSLGFRIENRGEANIEMAWRAETNAKHLK